MPFAEKFLYRFGAGTLSLLIAQTIMYPFDTVKRCLQLNGSLGHKTLYKGGILECFSTLAKTQGLFKGLYAGFLLNMVRCAPLCVLQFLMFQSFRSLSQPKREFSNPFLKTKEERLKYN